MDVNFDYADEFQSAPLTDVRGDKRPSEARARGFKFQSAPLTDVRGDLTESQKSCVDMRFNPLPSRM